jgi:DNA-directed RNA polymerase specialized sigma24 family protein
MGRARAMQNLALYRLSSPNSMNKNWVLTRESFEALLAWLDPNREVAGQKYEEIRTRLIKIFASRGCYEPEDLADETINRVTNKLEEIEATFIGERARYFYGVANKVHLEYLRRKPAPPLPPVTNTSEEAERRCQCLDQCVGKLTAENRELVFQYYQEEKRAKIEHRKQQANHLGIAVNALRIRAHRIRRSLQDCVKECLEEATP